LPLIAVLATPAPAQGALLEVPQAQAVLAPGGGPATEATLALPHRWDRAHPGQGGHAIYRFLLPAESPGAIRGLLLTRIGNQAVVSVDGLVVARFGRLGDPSHDASRVPHRLDLLGTGRPQAVTIEVTTQASRWGGLGRVLHGPPDEVRAHWRLRYLYRTYLSVAVATLMGMVALLALAFWWVGREPVTLQFALGGVLGVLPYLDRIWSDQPLPWAVWGPLVAICTIGNGVWFERGLLSLAGYHRPWLDRATWGYFGACSVLAAIAFGAGIPAVWTFVLLTTMPVTLWGAWQGSRMAWIGRTRQQLVVAFAFHLGWSTVAIDVINLRLVNDGPAAWSVIPLGTLTVLAIVIAVIVTRHARQTRAYVELNRSLDQQVAQREAELRARMLELQDEHAERVRLQERQRLMRDIHDGVGAQLVGLRGLIEREGVSRTLLKEQADGALDELRMAVDALQPVHGDLATVLATLRYRLRPRLEAAGIRVVWRVQALPPLERLTPPVVLELQRILLEAFTNVLRHAQADTVTVESRQEDGAALVLVVQDNGVGLPATPASGGHGLRNMRARAEAIGVTLVVERAPTGGTRVVLVVQPDAVVVDPRAAPGRFNPA
jgi:signal transduction histidine kinase